ncbi:hypothetical protein DTO164E3_4191 [Paecilomyces variotii]|nr:hypothetical protein DTO032I3_9133 [Paecilomyces variotii]KAJ9200180.1 hypothetical protein DTO164E3_4191 [Paecilomyces variotii]KAJ9281884.1 hypothetical protein DTO021D3_1180 [Paecilomyces variotii]KAJ9347354.1 hypothetical protein DTO027B6_228 [Paecilomyces variotii]KAJ9388641.1 hypothetical protein DTO032I4_2611 [Paecilomyces variotii]
MATEGIRTASEANDALGAEEKNGPTKDVESQQRSPRVTDEPKPDEKSAALGETEALQPPTTEDSNGPKTGEKRPINGSDNSGNGNKDGEQSGESSEKKQKAEQPSEAEHRPVDPSASNDGEKKKQPGRPKKLKDASKKPTPRSTEGIGSRTRSRTKAT